MLISIGSFIEYPTVRKKLISDKVEVILENTLLIRDKYNQTHLNKGTLGVISVSMINPGFKCSSLFATLFL